MTERDLLERLGNGDENTAQTFEFEYRPRLMRFLASRGIMAPDAEDLVQDTFLAVFQQIREGRFRGDSRVSTWMISILNNKVADHREAQGRRALDIPLAKDASEGVEQRELKASPQCADDPENRAIVTEALNHLPRLHRVILLLHEAEGWITDEIADRLKMNPGTVGRKLWEAKQMLRAHGRSTKRGEERKQIGPPQSKKFGEERD